MVTHAAERTFIAWFSTRWIAQDAKSSELMGGDEAASSYQLATGGAGFRLYRMQCHLFGNIIDWASGGAHVTGVPYIFCKAYACGASGLAVAAVEADGHLLGKFAPGADLPVSIMVQPGSHIYCVREQQYGDWDGMEGSATIGIITAHLAFEKHPA